MAQVKHVETVNVSTHVSLKIHVLHLLYVPLTITDQAVNVHLGLLETQDHNVAKSREENVITMMNVLIIKPVLSINVLIHVSHLNLVEEKLCVRQAPIELCVDVHQTGEAILMSNVSNMNV